MSCLKPLECHGFGSMDIVWLQSVTRGASGMQAPGSFLEACLLVEPGIGHI